MLTIAYALSLPGSTPQSIRHLLYKQASSHPVRLAANMTKRCGSWYMRTPKTRFVTDRSHNESLCQGNMTGFNRAVTYTLCGSSNARRKASACMYMERSRQDCYISCDTAPLGRAPNALAQSPHCEYGRSTKPSSSHHAIQTAMTRTAYPRPTFHSHTGGASPDASVASSSILG